MRCRYYIMLKDILNNRLTFKTALYIRNGLKKIEKLEIDGYDHLSFLEYYSFLTDYERYIHNNFYSKHYANVSKITKMYFNQVESEQNLKNFGHERIENPRLSIETSLDKKPDIFYRSDAKIPFSIIPGTKFWDVFKHVEHSETIKEVKKVTYYPPKRPKVSVIVKEEPSEELHES